MNLIAKCIFSEILICGVDKKEPCKLHSIDHLMLNAIRTSEHYIHTRGSTQRDSLATQKLDSLEWVPKPACQDLYKKWVQHLFSPEKERIYQ